MLFIKSTSFSPDTKYFACFSISDELLIWETYNSTFINCKYDSSVYSTCTSMHWVLPQHKYTSPQKKLRKYCLDSHLLAVGTSKGDVLLYSIANKNIYLHLVARHSDAVNDMCFYSETNSLFTCSDDKFIAIWGIPTGKEISKWKVGDSPVSSISAIDDNNLLSAGTSILWWNISEKCVMKKFSGHSTEIFKLLPVNAVSLNTCYFLSSAVSDLKVNAWSLNSAECQTPVASFVLPDQPEDVDISKVSSKDKPLILSVVTKNGFLHLFEHILNGNLNQPIQPKVSIEINSKTAITSVISTKLSSDSESCIVAYGTSKSNMTFKHIKVRESLKQKDMQNTAIDLNSSLDIFPVVKETNKTAKGHPINGIKSTSENSSKVKHLKEADAVISNYRSKLRSSTNIVSVTEEESLNICETEDSKKSYRSSVEEIDIEDSKNPIDVLLKGIQTQNEDTINVIFNNKDTEFISALVQSLPTDCLREVLSILSNRLNHHKYFPTLSKWLKEILRVHFNYLLQSQDTREILSSIKKQINSMKISETICKLSFLKGFLNLQMQNSSGEESDSESETLMEL